MRDFGVEENETSEQGFATGQTSGQGKIKGRVEEENKNVKV